MANDNSRIIGNLEAKVETLSDDINDIRIDIKNMSEQVLGLRDDLMQRRGAYKMLLFLCAAISGVMSAICTAIGFIIKGNA